MKPWTIAASVAATIFFGLALSNEVYRVTSPVSLWWHVLLRKSYSIVAFAIVGYLARRALQEHARGRIVLRCVTGVALYSAAIEAGQFLLGSHEGLGWNIADILCGAAGGSLAVADLLVRRPA